MFSRKSPRLSRRRRRAARSARRRAFPCAVAVVFEHPCGPGGAGTGEGCRFLDFEFNRIKKDSFLRFYFPLVLRAISTKERCSESFSKIPRRNLSTGHSTPGLISRCAHLISESLVSITSVHGETLLTVWLDVSFVSHNRHRRRIMNGFF